MAQSGLNIAALARRTGVQPDTLRKWEQRYGVLRPRRTPGGQRRYDDADLARVEWLKSRLDEGYRIGEAAALLGQTSVAGRTTAELREAIVAGVDTLDVAAVDQLLEQSFVVFPLERALAEVVVPVLRHVGELWSTGRFSVAQEHLLSAAVRTRLERLLAEPRAPVRGEAVLACAPGERHDLGLLMLAIVLRADGWRVTYLGADTPVGDALRLAEQTAARALCISVTMDGPAEELARSLHGRKPSATKLVVGGQAMTRARAGKVGGRYVPGEAPSAVPRMATLAR